jgi:histone-lysine N-methyltransferase SETMAR
MTVPHCTHSTADLQPVAKFDWETSDHLTYSPDLAPSDFHLFPILKEHLLRHNFTSDEDVKLATIMLWTQQGHMFYLSRMDRLITRSDKYLYHQVD